jgi:threonylcarbamoyladenosine tRNA methylthiotransferase MtaB
MKRVALHTLGCKLNFAESSAIGKQFRARGFTPVTLDQPADVVLINTCSVTERADRECRQLVRRALRHSPEAYVIVTGCYAQLQPQVIAEIPGVDLVLGTAEKLNLFDHVSSFRKESKVRTVVGPIREADTFSFATSAGFTDRTRAFLKVQDGCDFSCSFCTIPRARGISRSAGIPAVVQEARNIVSQGYKEIVLSGVNVGDYGKKVGTSFLELLQELVKLDGLQRLRISSIEPNLVTAELLDFWLSNNIVCKHFHIPLQSGSNEILKRMRRRYRKEQYAELVLRIRSACPDACIGADVLSGFPGETDTLFEETYRFLQELPLSYIHPFTYSERPNTPAATFPSRVEPRVRFERTGMVRNLSLRKRLFFYESFVGRSVEVLFEHRQEGRLWSGLTDNYIKVMVESDLVLENQILPVMIESVSGDVCFGKLIDVSEKFRQQQLSAA